MIETSGNAESMPERAKLNGPLASSPISTTIESTLRDELQQVRKEFEELLQLLNEAKTEIRARDIQLERYEETNSYCQKLLQRNSALEFTIGQLQDEFECRLKDYEQQLIEKIDEKSAVASDREIKRKECEKSTREIEDLRSRHSQLRESNLALQDRVNELNHQIRNLKEDVSLAKEEKNAAQSAIDSLKEEHLKLRDLYQRQLMEISQTGSSVQGVIKENINLAEERSNFVMLIKELKARNRELRQNLVVARNENDRLVADTEDKQKQINAVYEQYEKLRQSLNSLTGDSESQDSMLGLQGEVKRLQSELEERDTHYKIRVSELEVANMRMKEQLKNYDQVHQTASDLLQKNEELGKLIQDRSMTRPEQVRKQERQKYEEAVVDLKRCRKEIKSLEAQILVLNKRLSQVTEASQSPDVERALHALDKQFIESLKQDQSAEIQKLHNFYQSELEKLREQSRSMADMDKRHALEAQERSLRAEFVREFELRLKEHESEVNEHYKDLLSKMDLQNKNRLASLKNQLALSREGYETQLRDLHEEMEHKLKAAAEDLLATKKKYEDALRSMQVTCDEKLYSAASEMESVLKLKDDKMGELKSTIGSLELRNKMLETELEAFRSQCDSIQKSYEAELEKLKAQIISAPLPILDTELNTNDLEVCIETLKSEFESEKKRLSQKVREGEDIVKSMLSDNIRLQKKIHDLESQLELKCQELTALQNDVKAQSQISSMNTNSSVTIQKLIERNKDLEETIAILSARIHDQLKERALDISQKQRKSTLKVVEVESSASINTIKQLQQRIAQLELSRSELYSNLAAVSDLDPNQSMTRTPEDEDKAYAALKELYAQLEVHLKALSSNVELGISINQDLRDTVSSTVDKQIEFLKLEKKLELLQKDREAMVKEIAVLEQELAVARTSDSHSSDDSHQSDELYAKLLAEKERLVDLTAQMRQNLENKEHALRTRLASQSEQLELLEVTKAAVDQLMTHNAKLDNSLKQKGIAIPVCASNFEKLEQLLTALESHGTSLQEAHSLEILRLQRSIRDSEAEKERLRLDKSRIEKELMDAHQTKIRLLEEECQAKLRRQELEVERYKALNEKLRDQITEAQKDASNTREEAELKMHALVTSISSQISQNEIILASIQDENSRELDEARRNLTVSLEAQRQLADEVKNVSEELQMRRGALESTRESLRQLVCDMGGDPAHAIESIRSRYNELLRAFHRSNAESERLASYFDALIKRQELELRLAKDQKRQLRSADSKQVEDYQKVDSELNHIERALKQQVLNSRMQTDFLSKRISFLEFFVAKLKAEVDEFQDLQSGLSEVESLNMKSALHTEAALDATCQNGIISKALTTLVSKVNSLVCSIESRSTTAESIIEVSSKRPLSSQEPHDNSSSGKRPRL